MRTLQIAQIERMAVTPTTLHAAALFTLVALLTFTHCAWSAEEPAPAANSTPQPDSKLPSAQSPEKSTVPDAIAPKPVEKEKADGDKKPVDDKKSAEEKKPDEDKKAEVVEEKIPPPPEPTAADLEKREKRAEDFMTLGEKFFGFPITGTSVTRFRARNGAGDHDQDMYEFVSMDFGDKDRQLATGHFDLRFDADLNGRRTGVKADVFSGLVDTYSSARETDVYSAYADFHKIPGVEFLRAGRQWNYDTSEVLPFDGVRLDTDPWLDKHELKFSFYGGVPIHDFATVPIGGVLAGAAVEGRPWASLRVRLDFTHIDDDLSNEQVATTDPVLQTLNASHSFLRNNLASVSLWQVFRNPDLRFQARASELDGRARDGMARAVYNKSDWNLQVSGTYNVWFEQQKLLVNQFDMFYDTLAGQEPYHNGSLVVSKGWTDNFWMETGAQVRRLTNSASETTFNHEFDRYYTTLQLRDLPVKGLTFGVTASRWDGRGQSPASDELGGDMTYTCGKKFLTSAGTDYALYKYDLFQGNELDQVRTYYLKQRWKPKPWAALDVNFEHERSLKTSFNTLTVTFRFDF